MHKVWLYAPGENASKWDVCLSQRKRYNSTLNLTLMTVIIYTGNKVKPNRGEKWEKASTDFFSFGQQTISMKIYCI